jgi:hypothetical protein
MPRLTASLFLEFPQPASIPSIKEIAANRMKMPGVTALLFLVNFPTLSLFFILCIYSLFFVFILYSLYLFFILCLYSSFFQSTESQANRRKNSSSESGSFLAVFP